LRTLKGEERLFFILWRPELDRPVHRRGQDKVGEVLTSRTQLTLACSWVSTDLSQRGAMPQEGLRDVSLFVV
jgi:hypothetical protein